MRNKSQTAANAAQNTSYRASVARATDSHQSAESAAYIQSNKGYAVVSYFKDRQFSGAPEKSVNNLIRDYQICAAQQSFDVNQMSLFFVNALADPAREFFLTHCSPSMPFDEIVTHMRDEEASTSIRGGQFGYEHFHAEASNYGTG